MRNLLYWLISLAGAGALALGSSEHAVGQAGPKLSVDSQDDPLVISGTLDEATNTFSRNVRLTLTGGSATELTLLSSDLIDPPEDNPCDNTDPNNTDPNNIIDRSNVTIPAGIAFAENQTRDVRVTVSAVDRPGDYSGSLRFQLPDQSPTDALCVNLEMHISPQPDVVPQTTDSSFQVARSSRSKGIGLIDWMLPSELADSTRDVLFENRTPGTVKITDANLVMLGNRTGKLVGSSDIGLELPPDNELPEDEVVPIGLTIDRNNLPPDRYQGTLRLKLDGAENPVMANLALDVRDGPLVPLLIIVVGIVVGRIASSMTSPAAQMQIKLLPRYQTLWLSVQDVKPKSIQDYLKRRLEGVRDRIEFATDTEQALLQRLVELDDYIRLSKELEFIRQQAQDPQVPANARDEINAFIGRAHSAILQGNIAAANTERGNAWQRLHTALPQDLAAQFAAELPEIREQGPEIGGVEEEPQWKANLKHAVSWLAGAEPRRVSVAQVRYELLRPLLFLVLLVLLALLGWQTLYINNGATFGVGGLLDYLGLFIWGVSSDIATKTLQNLPLAR